MAVKTGIPWERKGRVGSGFYGAVFPENLLYNVKGGEETSSD